MNGWMDTMMLLYTAKDKYMLILGAYNDLDPQTCLRHY